MNAEAMQVNPYVTPLVHSRTRNATQSKRTCVIHEVIEYASDLRSEK